MSINLHELYQFISSNLKAANTDYLLCAICTSYNNPHYFTWTSVLLNLQQKNYSVEGLNHFPKVLQ